MRRRDFKLQIQLFMCLQLRYNLATQSSHKMLSHNHCENRNYQYEQDHPNHSPNHYNQYTWIVLAIVIVRLFTNKGCVGDGGYALDAWRDVDEAGSVVVEVEFGLHVLELRSIGNRWTSSVIAGLAMAVGIDSHHLFKRGNIFDELLIPRDRAAVGIAIKIQPSIAEACKGACKFTVCVSRAPISSITLVFRSLFATPCLSATVPGLAQQRDCHWLP
jgi:hypothetical protein